MPNPSQQSGTAPEELPSDELLLAAIGRAIDHEPGARGAATLAAILEHLDLGVRTAAARQVRAQLTALERGGVAVSASRHGLAVWSLSGRGRSALAAARRGGCARALPESPQHRAWHNARLTAAHELERFRGDLRERLADTIALLECGPQVHSDVWFERAEELQRACWRVGSATHCLREWDEPEDAGADVDHLCEAGDRELDPAALARRRARRCGRRNMRLWQRWEERPPARPC